VIRGSSSIWWRQLVSCLTPLLRRSRARLPRHDLRYLLVPAILVFLISPYRAFPQTSASREARRRRTLPLSSFYDTPLPAGHPGQIIRSQTTDDYDLPEGISAVRILYYSRGANGQDVPASAVLLVPDRKPPAGGWPVLAWAHSFAGVARGCAPSLRRNLLNGPFLVMYAKLGYAIVATDYAGLATTARNAVMDVKSNANDVIYAVAAARAARPELGRKWIAMGDSMGGEAALAIAELEGEIHDPDFLGSVAIGNLAQLKDVYVPAASGTPEGNPVLLAFAAKTVYPQLDVRDILTDRALETYQHLSERCDLDAANSGPAAQAALKPNWQSSPLITQFFQRNELGHVRADGPILILAPEADRTATSLTDGLVHALCNRGDRVEYNQYSVSPGVLLGSTVRDQMAWIQDRFAGRPAPSNCH
jgi:alpha-beta hydrolase superfamily lysophospholipase